MFLGKVSGKDPFFNPFEIKKLEKACPEMLLLHIAPEASKKSARNHPFLFMAALTSPVNRGCGRSGRLVNSGWACVPTKNG